VSAREAIITGLAGKTVKEASYIHLPEDDESPEVDRDRITIWFTDGTYVVLESCDQSEYSSWIAVLECGPKRQGV